MIPTTRRDFIATATTLAALGGTATLVACGGEAVPPTQFRYGVASGDPLADRVILWTHAKRPNEEADVKLSWQVASDAAFGSIVSSGSVTAASAAGHTAKVDASGLAPGNTYFFRFQDASGTLSPMGTTRTLPSDSATSVKLAVFSCALYPAGFFNVYDNALDSGAQFAIHLGDYLYEYGSDPAKYGNTNATDATVNAVSLGRVVTPANDLHSLDDYRTRYAQYRQDDSLQALHSKMPWIVIWDDHEFANNAYMDGAQDHDASTQGSWAARKAAAAQAYHEWMPIRTPDPSNLLKIYRKFDFGTLFSLHMLDTRIEGRTKQAYGYYGDPSGVKTQPYDWADYLAGLTPVAGVYPDAANRMMSSTQFNWLTRNIAAATTTWQILGNQTIMAKLWYPQSVIAAIPQGTDAVIKAISTYLNGPRTEPRIPVNMDSWDGYPIQREALLQAIRATGKKLVVLSGDSHNAWFNNLMSLDGSSQIGVEFATPSVTAPGYESMGMGAVASTIDGARFSGGISGTGTGLISDVNYCDTLHRGYLLMTISAASVHGEFVYVENITSKSYVSASVKSVTVAAGNLEVSYA